MVDNVRLGLARPVPTHRPPAATEVVRVLQPTVTQAASATLSLATALAQSGPPYDADKVAQLRAEISSGTYTIDLGAVADAIMRFGGGPRE